MLLMMPLTRRVSATDPGRLSATSRQHQLEPVKSHLNPATPAALGRIWTPKVIGAPWWQRAGLLIVLAGAVISVVALASSLGPRDNCLRDALPDGCGGYGTGHTARICALTVLTEDVQRPAGLWRRLHARGQCVLGVQGQRARQSYAAQNLEMKIPGQREWEVASSLTYSFCVRPPVHSSIKTARTKPWLVALRPNARQSRHAARRMVPQAFGPAA
jgi:hypothetical protein